MNHSLIVVVLNHSLIREKEMSELISGKDALIALANGEEVQGTTGCEWADISIDQKLSIKSFTTGKNDFGDAVFFRLKPRTITLNGVELSPCVSIGICRIKNEVSIRLKDESDADRLYALLTKLFGFRG